MMENAKITKITVDNGPVRVQNNDMENSVIIAIKKEMKTTSLRQIAAAHGLSKTHLHDVVHGRRDVSLRVGAAFGFEWSDKGWRKVKEVKNGSL